MSELLNSGKRIPIKRILKVKDWKRKKDTPSEPVKTMEEIELSMTSVEIKGKYIGSGPRFISPGIFTTERDIDEVRAEIEQQLDKENFFIPVRTVND